MLAASGVPTWSNSALLAAPELAFCAFSGRAWWLWAARHSQSEAQPLGAPPPPRGLKRAASEVADATAFDHVTTHTQVSVWRLDERYRLRSGVMAQLCKVRATK